MMNSIEYAKNARSLLDELRRNPPLVQIITNYVTVNDVANALLCLGASPAMVEAENEVRSFLPYAQALCLNVGTLSVEQARAMRLLLPRAKELGVPVLLDPVACGVIKERMSFVETLLESGALTIVKGNSAEILSLAGKSASARGVDALANAEDEVREAVCILAKKYSCTVAATGAVDFISDGSKTLALRGGSAYLTRFSGSGCILGGLMAAAAGALAKAGAGASFLQAAITAAACMKCAAEAAESAGAQGPMSFKITLFDTLAALTGTALAEWTQKNIG